MRTSLRYIIGAGLHSILALYVRKLSPERLRVVLDGPLLDMMLQGEYVVNSEWFTVIQVALLKVYR
jgi:hypothetical protein